MFLETYFQKSNNWHSRKELSEFIQQFYHKSGNKEGVITAMMSSAKCEQALGNSKDCKKIEKEVLENTLLDHLPSGFKCEVKINIIVNKIGRNEYSEAEELLKELKVLPEAENFNNYISSLEGEIYRNTGRYEKATEIYLKLEQKSLQGQLQSNSEKIGTRLKELSEKIGAKRYQELKNSIITKQQVFEPEIEITQ
jgi:tetratricopeptide (TPR) repeat protein